MTSLSDAKKSPLLEVRDLHLAYATRDGQRLTAVDGLSFDVSPGETLGLVGESGCGKSSAARAILHLARPSAGSVTFRGRKLGDLSLPELRAQRRHMQIIFQDPVSSLNPRMRVGDIIAEPLVVHGIGTATERRARVAELMTLVGLDPGLAGRSPHQFSGGQAQRIGIARALATSPDFIVADEAISGLDVSVQAQVINLLADLRERLNLTYLFISHNLAMVRYISQRVAVMYLGRFVEIGSSDAIFAAPLHPYTRTLLDAVPVADPVAARARGDAVPEGEPPNPRDPPSGCRYHPRCAFRTVLCAAEVPTLRALPGDAAARLVACHHAEQFMSAAPLSTARTKEPPPSEESPGYARQQS